MSMSLLKKSMAIVEEDLSTSKKNKVKETAHKKRGVFKPNASKSESPITKSAVKKTMQEIRQEVESSNQRAEENINKLLLFSKQTVKIRDAEKIIQRAHSGRYIVEKKEPVEVQESIFTEEDFAAFEKELEQTFQTTL